MSTRPPRDPPTYTGYITDKVTGSPISGVLVRLYSSGSQVATGYSNNNGYYCVGYEYVSSGVLKVEKVLYETQSRTVSSRGGRYNFQIAYVGPTNFLDNSGGDQGWSPVYYQQDGQWMWDQHWTSSYRHQNLVESTPYGIGTRLKGDRYYINPVITPRAFYQYLKIDVAGSGPYKLHLDFFLREDSSTQASSVDNWELLILSGKHSNWEKPLYWHREPNCDEHGVYQHQIFNIPLNDHHIYLLIGHWDSWVSDWNQGHSKYFNKLEIHQPTIAVIVNHYLWSQNTNIQSAVTTYRQDITLDGYNTLLYTDQIVGTPVNPDHLQLRTILKDFYYDEGICGAILVGTLPVALMYTYEDFICDLYFMDLDGTWTDETGDYLGDHTATTPYDKDPEIFLARIDASRYTFEGTIVENTCNLLDRFHSYRTDPNSPHHRSHEALVYIDDDWHQSVGLIDPWFENIYPTRTVINNPSTTTSTDWEYQITQDYEYGLLYAHSTSLMHGFGPGGWGSEGLVYSSEINAIKPNFNFYSLFCCHAADFRNINCLATTYLFSGPSSLTVISNSQSGGMWWGLEFYNGLAAGKCIGIAFQEWFSDVVYHDNSENWYYGMCILGDPLLTIN